ncbi:MAG: enoyl-CoA hydratase/isomerase family protein [Dehalococcoidia bacterium]
MSDPVIEEQKGAVLTLTLNRPEVLNSLNRDLGGRLLAAIEQAGWSDSVRVIVLRGAGRAFCAGDDLKASRPDGQARHVKPVEQARTGPYYNIVRAIRRAPKPVITRVHGYAFGAGCDLVLASDIAVAADTAQLGLVFIKRAIVGGTNLIGRHVGMKEATRLLFTGDALSGSEALRHGLVTEVVPERELDAHVDAWAARMAEQPTEVLGYIKSGINRSLWPDLDAGLEYQAFMQVFATHTLDRDEGKRAFLEKRPAVYSGR